MGFYVTIVILSGFFAGISDNLKRRNQIACRVFYCLSALVMFFPLALRSVGVDYEMYGLTYESTAVGWQAYWSSYLGRPEPLYALLNFAARWIFGSYRGVNVLCAFLTIGFSFTGLARFSEKTDLGTAVFCFGFNCYLLMFGLNRMMIAVAIVTWAWHFYFAGKARSFLFWCAVAGLFHYSALLMIPFYFILSWMEGKGRVGRLIRRLSWSAAAAGVTAVFVLVYRFTPVLFGSMPWFVRYASYFQLSFTTAALNNNAATYPVVLLALLYRKRLGAYLGEYRSLLMMLALYAILTLACVVMPVHRITYFFYPVCALLYGALPASGILSGAGRRMAVNSLYFSVMAVMGVLWIGFFLQSELWGPFLVPYRM